MKKLFMVAVVLIALSLPSSAAEQDVGKAKYVFLFIGDGTSFAQRHAAEIYLAHRDGGGADARTDARRLDRLTMNSFPVQGLCDTFSASSLVTDSAAAATALATGRKTRNGVLAMSGDLSEKYRSLAWLAKSAGKKVGLVSSVSLDHATPAGFYAHSPSRSRYYDIAAQAPESGFDYFAGGGFKQPTGSSRNQKDVFELFRARGYSLARTREEFDALSPASGRVLAVNPVLDGEAAMPFAVDRAEGEVSLAEFVVKGIELLDGPDGFFFMIEGGKIDWACHANDAYAAINDVIALDEAVGEAYRFYRDHQEETLIVVTGDHETGGMAIGSLWTSSDIYPEVFDGRRGSYLAFTEMIYGLMDENLDAAFEDVLPALCDFIGAEALSAEERAEVREKAAAGDATAKRRLRSALRPPELESLRQAFQLTWHGIGWDEATASAFGSYEPLAIVATRMLDGKAGIGWTSLNHTGLPVPVSAVGVGADRFGGHYDNTDVFRKIVAVAGYPAGEK